MTTAEHAERILRAAQQGRTISPLTDESPSLTIEEAYDIQDEVIALRQGAGEKVTGAKLGLTSVAKQLQMGVSEPLYGWLTDAMRLDAEQTVEIGRYVQPRVEPELAFITRFDLSGPGVTSSEVLEATATVAPALEILDSRFAGYRFSIVDVAADDASAAAYVLGQESVLDGDLRLTGCVFEKNGSLVETASGAAVMDHPAAAVAWFIRKLHERGRQLPAGSVLLAGAWTAAIPVKAGDYVRATFDRIGSVALQCE